MKYIYIILYFSFLICITLFGCKTTTGDIYYWGKYENVLYETVIKPGNATRLTGIMHLKELLDKANAKGKYVPPGVHAHLAYLYYMDGNYNEMMIHFQNEKKLFPESSVFIDGILKRIKKK
jgi:hypothetical protein